MFSLPTDGGDGGDDDGDQRENFGDDAAERKIENVVDQPAQTAEKEDDAQAFGVADAVGNRDDQFPRDGEDAGITDPRERADHHARDGRRDDERQRLYVFGHQNGAGQQHDDLKNVHDRAGIGPHQGKLQGKAKHAARFDDQNSEMAFALQQCGIPF